MENDQFPKPLPFFRTVNSIALVVGFIETFVFILWEANSHVLPAVITLGWTALFMVLVLLSTMGAICDFCRREAYWRRQANRGSDSNV